MGGGLGICCHVPWPLNGRLANWVAWYSPGRSYFSDTSTHEYTDGVCTLTSTVGGHDVVCVLLFWLGKNAVN